ncbi:hypothetical protein ACFYKX_11525 [Cytobacillus sp. FJAT-54145]|uniref:Uncharacterized protein n=1 Tax=Cytobacillus spartinae TaxID=3299023 RepID=A0ABW6KAG2_9BACI
MKKETPLYVEIWRQVAKMVETMPKSTVRNITDVVKLLLEQAEHREEQQEPEKKKPRHIGTLTQTEPPLSVMAYLFESSAKSPSTLTEEDVWGAWDENRIEKRSEGMVVARHPEVCPIFGDSIPYKSVTVVCKEEQYQDVCYWLEYVHGAGCIQATALLPNDRIAIRSEYQAD